MWLIRKTSPWSAQSKFYKIGNPPARLVSDFEDLQKIKDELELQALKENYVSNNYEYWDVNCDEELIALDNFLFKNYGFNVLVENYNKDGELNLDDVISEHFPDYLYDSEILDIQKFIGRYHYGVQKVTERDKYIILFNSKITGSFQAEGIARTHEFKYYNSEAEALESVLPLLHRPFDNFGTWEIVGAIHDNELTPETNQILQSQDYIKFRSITEDYGQKFYSSMKLKDIPNGEKILMDLFKSVNKVPFFIEKLRNKKSKSSLRSS